MMTSRLLRQTKHARSDTLLIALAVAQGALLVSWASIPMVALGLWWNANSISHNFIHRPFFRTRILNSGFSCYLSLLLGVPQSLWRARHLTHHYERDGAAKLPRLKLEPLDF